MSKDWLHHRKKTWRTLLGDKMKYYAMFLFQINDRYLRWQTWLWNDAVTFIVSIRLWTFSSSSTGGKGRMMMFRGTLWTSPILLEWIDLLASLLVVQLVPNSQAVFDMFLFKRIPDFNTTTRRWTKRNICGNISFLLTSWNFCLDNFRLLNCNMIGCSDCQSLVHQAPEIHWVKKLRCLNIGRT